MEGLVGKVIEVQRTAMSVQLPGGSVVLATVRGQFHDSGEYPKVGDNVRVRLVAESEEAFAVVEEILPRTSVIERYDEVNNEQQVIVANADLMIIVMGLDGDFNIARLERYLALALQSNIAPIIVLNKSDATGALQARRAAVAAVAGDVPVYVTNAKTGAGLEPLRAHFNANTTAVLLGSSGVGKSTITNWLLEDDRQSVSPVRTDDSRGRHTTTTRQLFALPSGGFLIDTPGIRELALVGGEVEGAELVAEVERLAMDCKFRNCDHEKSAGCAVLAAVKRDELAAATVENYHKLARERNWLQQKAHGGKGQYAEQVGKRGAQSRAVEERKRLSRR